MIQRRINMPSKKSYYAIQSKNHFYCVHKRDFLVADIATVRIEAEVRFKYGNNEYNGVVMSDAGAFALDWSRGYIHLILAHREIGRL